MKNEKDTRIRTLADVILQSKTASLIISILSIVLGVIVCILNIEYLYIGIILSVCGVFLLVYLIGSTKYSKKEEERQQEKSQRRVYGQNDTAIRWADNSVKSKILLETTAEGYKICYRRVKTVNELIINDLVYDEKKGIIEFAHNLSGIVDGHTIEAGSDEDGYSYIRFDGEIVAEKERWI